MHAERRVQQRHQVRDAAEAFGFGIIGRGTDSSLGGMGLKYFTRQPSASSLSDLGIYLPDQNTCFPLPLPAYRRFHIFSMNVRGGIYFKNKCRIAFSALSKVQGKNLQDFIYHYAELITVSWSPV